jgi:hypothetical protein
MDFANLPGFDIEADLAPLTALQNTGSSNQQNTSPNTGSIPNFPFASALNEDAFPPPTTLGLNGNAATTPTTNSDRKVFFITNCGSLLGRTIAQVALDRGHLVAACAREKHLGDLAVSPLRSGLIAVPCDRIP